MARYVTFRFDDGFVAGARKAIELLRPNLASFFIVADLVEGKLDLRPHPKFVGRDFGSLETWRHFASIGHDVQLHSVSHRAFTTLSPEEQLSEINGSIAMAKRIHAGPYVFCYPYNDIPEHPLHLPEISASGFRTHDSTREVIFNTVGKLNPFELQSWAIRERHFDFVVQQMAKLPDETWTIFGLHSIDGEGHEPWTSGGLARLIDTVRQMQFRIVSVAQMIQNIPSFRSEHR